MCKKLICLVSFVLVLGLVLTSAVEADDPTLVGWWKFDEGSGRTAYDSSGYGNDGALVGNCQWVAGVFGMALEFDGTDAYVSVPNSSSLQLTSALTMAGWIKADSWGSGSAVDIIARKGEDNPNNYQLAITDGLSTLYLDDNDGIGYRGDTLLNTGQWYHVAATWDGSTVRIYVDGVLDNDPPDLHGDNISTDTRAFYIGGRSGNDLLDGTLDDCGIWDHALNAEEVQHIFNNGIGVEPALASTPSPADEATDVPREVVLGWSPGEYADTHDVYLGTVFDDVNDADRTNPLDVLASQGQSTTTYEPLGLLDFGQTYYWRIDEVNAPPDSTIFKGDVWSFTAELFAYSIAAERITVTASSSGIDQGPENTINGSGLDANDLHSIQETDMWLSDTTGPQPTWIQYEFDKVYKLHEMLVWNHNGIMEQMVGIGFKDVSIEYSVNGTDYTTLGTTHEFAQGTGAADYQHNTTIDFGGASAKFVRLTANSNWVGFLPQYGLSEVRFLYIPVFAREPGPDSGATDVAIDVTLGFRAGREAAKHDVYLSTDEQAVIDGTAPVTTVTENSYSPSPLDVDSTYYWRVDEVNDAETPTTWQGDIWNFTTPEFLVVDDFELYNDLDPSDPDSNRIFNTWIDGYGTTTNGSIVGYDVAPFAEQTIVHGGRQSMPFSYDNSTAGYSEATANVANLQVGQDWTKGAPETLVLWIYGDLSNAAADRLYVKINGTKVMYDGDITEPIWKQWNIELASLGINLSNITTVSIGVDGGGSGMLYVDDIALY